MAIDWPTVERNMIAAAEAVIAGDWAAVSALASAGIKALSTIAQEIVASADMAADEKQQLMTEYQQALTNTITASTSIGEALAVNAVSAALGVLIDAVPSLAMFV